MKKIIAIVALAASLSSNAFFNNWNNNGYNGYGYEDNGIFGYNPYDAFIDPRWYIEEMSNMMDDFGGWNNNNGYGYNPYYYGNPYYNQAVNPYTAPKTVAKPAAAK